MSASLPTGISLKGAVDELERHMSQEAFFTSAYNLVHAAQRLELSCEGLMKEVKRHGITA